MGEINKRFETKFSIKIYESFCDLCEGCIDICERECFTLQDNLIIWTDNDCTRCEECTDLCRAITPKFEAIKID